MVMSYLDVILEKNPELQQELDKKFEVIVNYCEKVSDKLAKLKIKSILVKVGRYAPVHYYILIQANGQDNHFKQFYQDDPISGDIDKKPKPLKYLENKYKFLIIENWEKIQEQIPSQIKKKLQYKISKENKFEEEKKHMEDAVRNLKWEALDEYWKNAQKDIDSLNMQLKGAEEKQKDRASPIASDCATCPHLYTKCKYPKPYGTVCRFTYEAQDHLEDYAIFESKARRKIIIYKALVLAATVLICIFLYSKIR